MADTKVPTPEDKNAVLTPYEKPDIAAITGIPEADEEDKDESAPVAEPAAPAPAPATPAPETKQ